MIALQLAISLVLLSSAGLLVRTLWNIQNVPLGMSAEKVIVAPILLPPYRYPMSRQRRAFFEDLESRLQSVPGLGVIAVADSLPLGGTVSDITGQMGTRSTLYASLEVQGGAPPASGTGGLVAWRRVSSTYFQALGIPIIRGRGFVDNDRSPSQQVIIISESIARRLFSNNEAIGEQIRTGPQAPFRAVVGVAANVKNNPGLAEPDDPEYYIPRKLDDGDGVPPQAAIILRTAADATAAAKAIRAATAEIDPALPVNVYTMRQRVAELTARPRFNAAVTGWFAVIGVLLSAIGLYGVVSFGTAQRTQEIGVRLALGATPGNILNLILSSSFRWTMSGMIVGLITSLFTTRLIRTLLFQVPEHDPWTLVVTIILLLTVSLLAATLPSIRASRLDAAIALRND